jgi:hypothetical protein
MLSTNHLLGQLPAPLGLVVAVTAVSRAAVAIVRIVMHNLSWRQVISKADTQDLPAITTSMAVSWGAIRESNPASAWRARRATRGLSASPELLTTAAELHGSGLVGSEQRTRRPEPRVRGEPGIGSPVRSGTQR